MFYDDSRTATVILSDLSPNGCKLTVTGLKLRANEHVFLRLPNELPIQGVVRWAWRSEVGVQFDEPLHPATVRDFCRTYPDTADRKCWMLQA